MESDRWKAIDDIFQAALDQACAGDAALDPVRRD